MDSKVLAYATIYARIREQNRIYYHEHATEISEQRRNKWRDTHPNPRPRGRPRKDRGVGVVDSESGNVSSSSSEVV